MTKNKNTPKLRFPESSGEWVEKELCKVANFSKGKGISKGNISEEGIECIRYGELYTTYNEKIEYIVSKTNLPKEELILSEKYDIIIPTSGETAIDLATASCVMKKDVAIGGDTNIIKTKENSLFLSYYLNNKQKEISSLAQGVSVVHLYASSLKKLKINLPSTKEQKKIANFLSTVDKKISLLEDKLNFFKDFKKFCMQQLFAQKLRFKNENGENYPDWEEKKLKHLVIIPKKEKLCSVENKILLKVKLHCKGIEANENLKPKITKRGRPYYERNTDEILIGRQNFHNGGFGIVSEELNGGIASNAITSLVTKNIIKNNFLLYYFSRSDFYKRAEILIGGTGQKELSQNELLKIKSKVPQLEEQEKIANFLINVDNKIDKTIIDLEQMKEFKKGLLQQMFI